MCLDQLHSSFEPSNHYTKTKGKLVNCIPLSADAGDYWEKNAQAHGGTHLFLDSHSIIALDYSACLTMCVWTLT